MAVKAFILVDTSPGKAREVSLQFSDEARKRFPEGLILARKGYITPPR